MHPPVWSDPHLCPSPLLIADHARFGPDLRPEATTAAPSGLGLVDVDDDPDPVGEHVEHGRAGPGLGDDRPQGLGRRIAGDPEPDPDLAVAVAHVVADPEDALQV